jgi:hypothetical protein
VIPRGSIVSEPRIPDFDVFHEKVKLCLERAGLRSVELWIYPLRVGYRVEILPQKSIDMLRSILECIVKELGGEGSIRESGGVLSLYVRYVGGVGVKKK